jgi:hypothetical protein
MVRPMSTDSVPTQQSRSQAQLAEPASRAGAVPSPPVTAALTLA